MEQKKKKSWIWIVAAVVVVLAVVLALTQCKNETPEWQEQYDLGLRYLSEGNYEEAILAFSAAIEIDPYVSNVYLGRGDAYVMGAEDYASHEDYDTAQDYLQKAEDDYSKAQELDPENGEIAERLENLEQMKEELIPEETEPTVPEEPPFYERVGLEINATPDEGEITDEAAIRQASWSSAVNTAVYFGTAEDSYAVEEILLRRFTLTVTEYSVSNVQVNEEFFSDEANSAIEEFLNNHPDYKIYTLTKVIEVGQLRDGYSLHNKSRWGIIDRYTGICIDPENYSGSFDCNGTMMEVFQCLGSKGAVHQDGEGTWWATYYGILAVPQDYDGAVFFVGYSDKTYESIPGEFNYYYDLPSSKWEAQFFAMPAEE